MIRINLLPEQHRRKARTPLKVFGLVVAFVAVTSLLASWYGWLAFGVMNEVQSELGGLQTEAEGLQRQIDYHKKLDGERKRFAGREEALAGVTKTRVLWTRKIDELITVINAGDDGRRHFVWLDDLVVTQNSDPRATSPGQLKAAGHSGSPHFSQVADFLEDLERSSFLEDFLPPSPPEGTQTDPDPELVPAVVWNFPLALQLRPREPAKVEPAKKPAKKAPVAMESKQ
jgi:Tfp pilus assembly protein PilN